MFSISILGQGLPVFVNISRHCQTYMYHSILILKILLDIRLPLKETTNVEIHKYYENGSPINTLRASGMTVK